MKCPHFIRKTGGYTYGWKCDLYHNGLFVLHSDGKEITYNEKYYLYDKDARDRFVKEKCLSNCNGCTLYQRTHKN